MIWHVGKAFSSVPINLMLQSQACASWWPNGGYVFLLVLLFWVMWKKQFRPESLSHFTQSDNPYDSLGFRLAWNQPLLKLIPDFGIWLPQMSQGAFTEGREKIYAWGIQRLKSESTFFLVFVLHVRGKPGQHFRIAPSIRISYPWLKHKTY